MKYSITIYLEGGPRKIGAVQEIIEEAIHFAKRWNLEVGSINISREGVPPTLDEESTDAEE